MFHGINDHGVDNRFGTLTHIGTLPVTLYGILVVLGFIIAVIIASIKLVKFYKTSYDPFLSFAIVAFPFGIFSASIWSYAIGNSQEWYSGFTGTGGLAIQGGVFMGTILGIFWFPIILRKPKYWINVPLGKLDQTLALKRVSTWIYFDAIIPVVLLGQAIGRWGNFFNYEVFGQQIGSMTYAQAIEAINNGVGDTVPLNWLRHAMPAVWQNMWISTKFNEGTLMAPGSEWANSAVMHQPLFLYESFFNIIIFALLYGVVNFIPKYKAGLIGGFSIVYTGVFRSITEPLRFKTASESFQFNQSIVLSGIIIAIGLLIALTALILGYQKIRNVQWYEYYFDQIKLKIYRQLQVRNFILFYTHKQDDLLKTRLSDKVNYDLQRLQKVQAIRFANYVVGDKKTKYYGQRLVQFHFCKKPKFTFQYWLSA